VVGSLVPLVLLLVWIARAAPSTRAYPNGG
jgi:hypothetical protein